MIEGLSLHAEGVTRWHAGELAASAVALDRAAALNRAWASASPVESMIAPISPVGWPRGHPVVEFVHMLIGDHDDPVAEFERMAADDMQPFGSTVVWMFAAFGALAIDDAEVAVAAGRRGLEADPDLVFTYWGPGAHMALGAALVRRGDIDEGLEFVARAMPRYLASGTRIFVPLVHARLAQGLAHEGRAEQAVAQLTRATELVAEHGERWLEPIVMAVAAEVDAIADPSDPTVADRLTRAHALAVGQGAHAVARSITASGPAPESMER